jgi:hypothetical protein
VPRLLAALFPDQVHALLVAQIADRPGISAAERAGREQALEAEIFRHELEEEVLVERSDGAILRRVDASPHALLGLLPYRQPAAALQAAE